MTAGTVIAGSLIIAVAITVTSLLARHAITHDLAETTAVAARQLAALVREDRLAEEIPPQQGVVRLQVVDAGGDVVAASALLAGEPPMSAARPGGLDDRVEDRVCAGRRCLTVVGFRVRDSAYGDVMVYAARPQPDLLTGHLLELMLIAFGLAVLAAGGWLVWLAVGRTLRPVERIRAELERFSMTDLDHRLTVPDTGDEVARLARTGNETLARLQAALARQRSFVSDASHELRSPITGLRTRLEVELADPRDPTGALRAALADTERLQRIVGDLLELARLDADVADVRTSVDLGDLAREEVRRLLGAGAGGPAGEGGRARPGGPAVTVDAEPGVVVRGDRLRLSRVLANLIANALRHADGRVAVEVAAEEGRAVLRVHDDGDGIAPADRERVFARFARLAESRRRDPGGSGLGLAISREIASAHGGTLTADRSPRLGGAVLELRLPLPPPSPDPTRT
ncbi:sensor histidine kinase [Nocardiopsis trehalosi]|uniref:sensor histidine kinase n=1 Tax=Nocardiopsis trehalosi TaxID=109329 RepID=UPI001FE03773|nr:HAMP domain-containing sensor histidine kinase [Nocardiopsis trehalosi]